MLEFKITISIGPKISISVGPYYRGSRSFSMESVMFSPEWTNRTLALKRAFCFFSSFTIDSSTCLEGEGERYLVSCNLQPHHWVALGRLRPLTSFRWSCELN